MEVIKGGSLRQLLTKRKKLTDSEAALVMKSLLSAVEHVHQKNYVHRDLKPENILINSEKDLSSVKLADFGLSASFRLNTAYSLNEKMGTLLFMAPEQTKNYSYGKVNYLILRGYIKSYIIEDRHVGLRSSNVHANRRQASSLRVPG
jgi:serine/threonine protein kinase